MSQKSTKDPATLANKFNEFYTSVHPVGKATADKTKLLAQEHNFNHCSSSQTTNSSQHMHEESGQAAFKFQLVTEVEVEKINRSLPSNKTPGIDKVSAKILKYSLPAMLPILTSIFNNSFAACTFPRAWKISEVTPILKSGDFDDPSNTRLISLLPILSIVCEKLAHKQFVNYLNCNSKIAKQQSGNRQFHSTETALLHFTDEILKKYGREESIPSSLA